MRDNISSANRGNKILPVVLIAANLLMLVIGVITIPPNLRSEAGKESPVPGTEQTSPITPPLEEQPPLRQQKTEKLHRRRKKNRLQQRKAVILHRRRKQARAFPRRNTPICRTFSGIRRTLLITEFHPMRVSSTIWAC